MAEDVAALKARLDTYIGQPTSGGGPSLAPDEVNIPMIRHWVDALDDRNPVYLDAEAAARSRYGGIVAPPTMLQVWTMSRPIIEGIAERGGAAVAIESGMLHELDTAGYRAIRATNNELEFDRYLRVGDRIQASTVFESVSDEKSTPLGAGFFVTWVTTFVDQHGGCVGRQRFTVFKFRPHSNSGESSR